MDFFRLRKNLSEYSRYNINNKLPWEFLDFTDRV